MENRQLSREVDNCKSALESLVSEIEKLEAEIVVLNEIIDRKDNIIESLSH